MTLDTRNAISDCVGFPDIFIIESVADGMRERDGERKRKSERGAAFGALHISSIFDCYYGVNYYSHGVDN